MSPATPRVVEGRVSTSETPEQVVNRLARINPGRRWAVSHARGAVAVWSNDQRRFVIVYAHLSPCQCMAPYNGGRCSCLTGWVRMPELFLNGEPIIPASEWAEVAPEGGPL